MYYQIQNFARPVSSQANQQFANRPSMQFSSVRDRPNTSTSAVSLAVEVLASSVDEMSIDDSTRTYFPETWLWDLANVPLVCYIL